MNRQLLNRAQVAAKLGQTVSWLYRNLANLVETQGFPHPTIGSMRGARWDPAAIDAWFDRRHAPGEGAQPDDPWAAKLDARAAALVNHSVGEGHARRSN